MEERHSLVTMKGNPLTLMGKELKVGDTIHFVGATTDFTQKVDSMEIDRNPVESVKPGDDVGIKVKERVREHDVVYKVPEE